MGSQTKEKSAMFSFFLSKNSGFSQLFQMLQWNSFADTAFIHLFGDGQFAAGTGRAEMENNCTNLMPAGVPGNGNVLGAANPQLFCPRTTTPRTPTASKCWPSSGIERAVAFSLTVTSASRA